MIVANTSKWSERSHRKKDTTFLVLFYFVYKYIINQGRISQLVILAGLVIMCKVMKKNIFDEVMNIWKSYNYVNCGVKN